MKLYYRTIMLLISILLFSLELFLPIRVSALGKVTHRAINEKNADKSSYLNQYLINNLGFKAGVEALINEKRINKYIGDGGEAEDAGFRSLNHFPNPITDQGILGYDSALQWASLPVATQPFSPFASWNDVRNNYLKALTATDKTTREDYFARTFQGIGQVMHLVEDMSVPAHECKKQLTSIWSFK